MARAAERSAARLAAVQALYQMDVTGKTLPDITAEFETFWIGGEIEGDLYNRAELAFFRESSAACSRTRDRSTARSIAHSCRRGRSRGSTA